MEAVVVAPRGRRAQGLSAAGGSAHLARRRRRRCSRRDQPLPLRRHRQRGVSQPLRRVSQRETRDELHAHTETGLGASPSETTARGADAGGLGSSSRV